MGAFGAITLRFGPTGDTAEVPLTFNAGHVNLIVGPNNSGKSLFLRELSGINPRAARAPALASNPSAETRIVSQVAWSARIEEATRTRVLDEALAEASWSIIGDRNWSSLIPGLRSAALTIAHHRTAFVESATALLADALLGEFPPWLKGVIGLMKAEAKGQDQMDTLTVWVAMFVLFARDLSWLQLADDPDDEEAPEEGEEGDDEGETTALAADVEVASSPDGRLFAREQFGHLETLVTNLWSATCEAVAGVHVTTADLSISDAVARRIVLSFIVDRVRNTPFAFVLDLVEVPELPLLDDPHLTEKCERLGKLMQWMGRPELLADSADHLEERYAASTWVNPETRKAIAAQALYLDGLARLSMTDPAFIRGYGNDVDDAPPILALLKDPDRMEILRKLVMDVLGAYLVVDMVTQAPSVGWRISSAAPPEGLETCYSQASHAYHLNAPPLIEQSDGIHALVGMLAAIMAGGAPLIFVDEPEAFLHPPLVRKLARVFAWIARELDRQFFIATHSPEMLASVAMAGTDVNIIRLTHRHGVPTARLLDSDTLRQLALDPLMRSESALSALFHDGAVVCEAAADRVLYQEVNERLLQRDEQGIGGLESVVFLDAQNWQTIPRIVGPLRRVGVAAAAVVDADALCEPHFTSVLEAACMPKRFRDAVSHMRTDLTNDIAKRLGNNGSVKLKRSIIADLTRSEQRNLQEILDQCAKYGVFIVPVGELEDWLTPLGLSSSSRDKGRWLRRALERLGSDPTSTDYVWPGKGDIWDFVRGIVRWVADPTRAGTAPTK